MAGTVASIDEIPRATQLRNQIGFSDNGVFGAAPSAKGMLRSPIAQRRKALIPAIVGGFRKDGFIVSRFLKTEPPHNPTTSSGSNNPSDIECFAACVPQA